MYKNILASNVDTSLAPFYHWTSHISYGTSWEIVFNHYDIPSWLINSSILITRAFD